MLEFFGLHLSVSDGDTGVWYVFQYGFLQSLQVTDSVVHDIHLSVAAHLEVYCINDDLRTESVNLCLNRMAVGWRRLYDTQVARTH